MIKIKKDLFKKTCMILLFLLSYKSVIAPASISQFDIEKYKQSKIIEYYNVKKTEELINQKLIKTIHDYIEKYSVGKSQLNAQIIINKCDEYKVDLKIVLAQAQLESHFGTRGRAVKTHSVFNVGALDNGKTLNFYDDPNHSIEPYIRLLKTKYLVNKTEKDLLYGNFIDITGKRYATSKQYERELLKIISNIQTYTNIDKLLSERKKITLAILQIENNNFNKQFINL